MAEENLISNNVCQYWAISEPGRCPNWVFFIEGGSDPDDPGAVLCGRCREESATAYPYCNCIGTEIACSHYAGSGKQSMCVLPNPSKHVIDRDTGSKWSTKTDGYVKYDKISGFNRGECDGAGTQFTCTAYSPYKLQFGKYEPDDWAGSLGVDVTTRSLGPRLPFNFEIYNRRALFSKCFWWEGPPTMFAVDDSGNIYLDGPWLCINEDTDVVSKYADYHDSADLNMPSPPCNGCKPECPKYTGTPWRYCLDRFMQEGDKILAEQVLEVRWHLKKHEWSPSRYYASFEDPEILAWDGFVYTDTGLIPATRVWISNFASFEISTSSKLLSQGLHDEGGFNYPTLVRRLGGNPVDSTVFNIYDDVDGNIFETCDVYHKYLAVIGEIPSLSTDVFAINISDPDLKDLNIKGFTTRGNVAFMRTISSKEDFDKWYRSLNAIADFLRVAFPEKTPTSELDVESGGFFIKVETFWGENDILVFVKVEDTWEFKKVTISKFFRAGLVGQKSFEVTGQDGMIDYLPSYQDSFNTDLNENGKADLEFIPLTDGVVVDYVYLDGVREQLPADPAAVSIGSTYEFTYKLYEYDFTDVTIPIENVFFFGNAGYAAVKFPENYSKHIHSTFKKWTVEFGEGESNQMEIYEQSSEILPQAVFIMRPKNIKDFKRVDKPYVKIKSLKVYYRHTFTPKSIDNVEVSVSEVLEDFIGDDDKVIYKNALSAITGTGFSKNFISLSGFADQSFMVAILFRGVTGKIIGQTKSKFMAWVRQPYCRDVEIMYTWKAYYTRYMLRPTWWCIVGGAGGRNDLRVGVTPIYADGNDAGLWSRSYTPRCGDHFLSYFSGLGPMWYPYTDCDDYASYNLVSRGATAQNDLGIMEIFTEEEAEKIIEADGIPHGAHDMRMLGPSNHFGEIGESIASLWACRCDWIHYNMDKAGANIFAGYGRFRGGLTGYDMWECIRNGGDPPRFGNVYRDFLRSYRSIDTVYYYYWDGARFVRRSKWVPMCPYYSTVPSDPIGEHAFLTYTVSDYSDEESNTLLFDPQGSLLVRDKIENVTISEKILYSELEGRAGVRFRFEDIFDTHGSWSPLYYPAPRNPITNEYGNIHTTWCSFKRIFGAGTSAQWAWREFWRSIERSSPTFTESKLFEVFRNHLTIKLIENIGGQYTTNNQEYMPFLDIKYPRYRYDGHLKEHRLVLDEGARYIYLEPPETEQLKGNAGSLSSFAYNPNNLIWKLQLNDGPQRCFNQNGWLPLEPVGNQCNLTLYDTCTKPPWVSDVTLFDTGYNNITPSEERTIVNYYVTPNTEEYYQRGLDVSIKTDALRYLPKELVPANHEFELSIDVSPRLKTFCTDSEWAYAEVDALYPFYTGEFNTVVYEMDDEEELNLTFSLGAYVIESESCGYILGGVAIGFALGSRILGADDEGDDLYSSSTFFHIPAITLSVYDHDIQDYKVVYDNPDMSFATKEDLEKVFYCFCPVEDNEQFFKLTNYFKITLRLKPNNQEYNTYGYIKKWFNLIKVCGVYPYIVYYTHANESIRTHERKYCVSTGGHGNFPPDKLYPTLVDPSTIYQYDSVYGVVGEPGSSGDCTSMNKLRGRIMLECHPDKEPLDGEDVYEWEGIQKEIHDKIAIESGNTSISFISCNHPGLYYISSMLGLRTPSWDCVMINTLVRPLLPVPNHSAYSPCGHTYIWDFSNLTRSICGGFPTNVRRGGYDTFDYKFKRYCEEGVGEANDWVVVAYYNGTGNVLTANYEYFNRPIEDYFAEVNARIAADKMAVLTSYSYPGSVDPVR